MLSKVFKRKLRIVSRGKVLFQQQKGNTGTFFVVLIMATIIAGSFYLVNGVPSRFFVQDPLDTDSQTTYSLDEKKIAKGKHDNLQLKTIPFVSNTPTPAPESREPNDRGGRPEPTRRQGGRNGDDEIVITQGPTKPPEETPKDACGIASPILDKGTDESGRCCVMDGPTYEPSGCCPSVTTYCDNRNPKPGDNCKATFWDPETGKEKEISKDYPVWCNAKPVIYLYPTKPTYVDVVVRASGPIVISDPLYPENGWRDALAYPDGKLVYQGKVYKELFYEAAIPPLDPPKTGIIVEKEAVKQELVRIATQQGLIANERSEFVDFWTDRLRGLNSPYVLLSVFSQEQKETFDHVDISPKPDTFIEFIAYFKPLEYPYPIAPLQLPKTPQQRIGFTAVEWGGILDE